MQGGRFHFDSVSCSTAMCHFQFAIKALYWQSIYLAPVADTDND